MSYQVNRRLVARRSALETPAQVDPVTAGIIRGAFETIGYETATHLGRGFGDTPVHLGARLVPGHRVTGPAVIEESFTTIVVYPGWRASVDDAGDYALTRED